ncbi:hypothetical protein GCM10027271_32130 [Saccharopolyspora gloriosae]
MTALPAPMSSAVRTVRASLFCMIVSPRVGNRACASNYGLAGTHCKRSIPVGVAECDP